MKAGKFRTPRTFGGNKSRHLIALISANLHRSVVHSIKVIPIHTNRNGIVFRIGQFNFKNH